MVSSPGDRDLSQPSEAIQKLILAQFQGDWVDRLSIDHMFTLIDRVLPFEACLYHQVLPLFIEGDRMFLGMVNLQDTPALEYARRMISYINYSVMPRQISSEALQVSLTAYLKYVGKKPVGKKQPIQAQAPKPAALNPGQNYFSIRAKIEQDTDPSDRKTLIVDSPEYLDSPPSQPVRQPASQPAPLVPTPPPKPIERIERPAASFPLNVSLLESLPVLAVQARHPDRSLESLVNLPPQDLLQELLSRVLAHGIGRLYFECHATHGRILWSQDGVLQSVLEQLPLPHFRGIIAALKQLMQLAPDPVDKPEQLEAEYLYDRNRILLRCRFMPNSYGEEATLQVLRGAALKFYQSQQVSKLERDAFGIAQQLQNKLKEIRDRVRTEPGLGSAKFDVLPALSQFLQAMEEESRDLRAAKRDEK